MSIALKVVVALGLAVALLLMCATAWMGSAAVAGGVATVAIRTPDGPDLRLAVPGVLISAVAAAVGNAVDSHRWQPGDHRRQLRAKLESRIGVDTLGVVTTQTLRLLEDIPDSTLVEIEDRGDLVRIVKRGRYLRLRVVDGSGELDVRLSLPIRTARRTAASLLG